MADNVALILEEVKKISRAISSGNGGLGGVGGATGGMGSVYSGGGYDGGGYPSSLREMRERFIANRDELKYQSDFSEIMKRKEEEIYKKFKENILSRRGGVFTADDEKRARTTAQKDAAKRAKEGADMKRAERVDARGRSAAGAAIGQQIGRIVGEGIEKITSIYLTWYNFQRDTTIRHNKMMHTITLNQLQNYGKMISTAVNGAVGSYMGGNLLSSIHGSLGLGQTAFSSNVNMAITEMSEKLNFAEETAIKRMEAQNKTIQATAGILASIGGIVATIPVFGWIGGAVIGGIAASLSGIAAAFTSIRETSLKLNMAEIKEQLENVMKMTEETVKDVEEMAKPFIELAKKVQEETLKYTSVIAKLNSEFNYGSENSEKFKDSMFLINRDISLFGKTLEDYSKIQSTYSEGTGRAINLSGRDANNIFATARIFGMDDNAASQLYSDMNLFNISVEDGSDMLSVVYKQISNIGLSTRRFGKDLAKNIKLAEKYDFKNGVEGLAKMTAWAEKMRFNMDNLPAALDKIQEGGIEDLLSNSAQLQVLGGNFAMYADPMAIAYEAFNDPDAYAKRLTKMTEGMGYFDKSIGSVRFSASDQIRLRQYAKTAGLDYNDVRKQINEQQKQSEVMKALVGSGWSNEQKSLLSSKAQWDKTKQAWMVNVMEKNADGQYEYVSKKLSALGSEDIKNLVPEDKEEQMIDIGQRQLSVEEEMLAESKLQNALLIQQTYGKTEGGMRQNIETLQKTSEEFRRYFPEKFGKIIDLNNETYKSQQESLNKMVKTDLIDNYVSAQEEFLSTFDKNIDKKIDYFNTQLLSIIKTGMVDPFNLGEGMTTEDAEAALSIAMYKLSQGGDVSQYFDQSGKIRGDLTKQQKEILKGALVGSYDLEGFESGNEIGNFNFKDFVYDFTTKELKQKGKVVNSDFGEKGSREAVNAIDLAIFKGVNQERLNEAKWDRTKSSLAGNSWLNLLGGGGTAAWLTRGIADYFFNDGIISPNGSSHIIPVNDAVVKTHPNDTVLAAKPGGPFDTLFDGIFGMVKEIHSALSGNASGNINVNVNGGIDLKSNGVSIENLRNNEMLKRAITEVVMENMSNKVNGGKNDMWKTNFRQ